MARLLAAGWLASLLWMAAAPAFADSLAGMPLLRRFTPADYHASPNQLALTTDASGRLYVGNIEGVLRFDGETWDLITLPGNAVARDVVTGADGRIYVSSYDNFGVLTTNATGEVAFQELLTASGLQGEDRHVGTVWEAIPTPDGVYFRAEHELFFISFDRKRRGRWPLSEQTRSVYWADGMLLSRVAGVGLCRFVDGKMLPEPGAEVFADQSLPGLIAMDGWRLLVGDRGLYRSDADGIVALPDDAGAELRDSDAYEVLPLRDGSFVVATLRGELLRYGPDFKLRERINLGSYGILALATDREGGLWAATEGDLVRLALPSPWSLIGPAQGLPGNALDFEWYDGALWLATSRGFVRMQADAEGRVAAQENNWIDFEAYALVSTPSGLLLGHRNGLKVLDPGQQEPRELFEANQEGVYEVSASRFDPDLAYGLSELNLFLIQRRNDRWQLGARIPLDGASAGGIIETARHEIWFGDSRGGPQRWRIDPVQGTRVSHEVFGEAQGLALDEAAGSFLYTIDGAIHAVSGARGFRFEDGRFEPDSGPPFSLVDRPNELVVKETPHGAYAFSTRQMWFRAAGARGWKAVHLGSRLAAGFGNLRHNADGVVRVSTWSGVLQFDASEFAPEPAPLSVVVDQVDYTTESGEVHRLPAASVERQDVAPGSRLHFRYTMVHLAGPVEYRYRVERDGQSHEEPWSEWTDRDLFIRTLTPGDYELSVEARTDEGRTSPVTTYRYRVLPYWYETALVRVGLFALLAVLLYVVGRALVHRRTLRLQVANRRLEQRVAERTSQLQEANQALHETNAELVASREQVISSGKRADLIFKALNDALAGTVLDDHYRVDQRIGSGGFGTVYRATEMHMDNVVAIKVFKPVPGHDAKRSMERFRAEGHSAFLVNHPNAVRVLDFGVCMDAVAYLVMEYLGGASLTEVLVARRKLPVHQAVSILRQVCSVLAHAHEVGVIHRDVKPSNILLCEEHDHEVVKLIDFGIAKVLDEATPNEMKNLTATGLLMGTPNYMAPERFLEKEYDGTSDVYSLGVIAYEMLSGSRPFPDVGENYLPLAMHHIHDSPPDLAARVGEALPPGLADYVMRMLAKRPDCRPTAVAAAAFFAQLEATLGPTPIESVPVADRADATSPAPSTQVFGTAGDISS